MKNSMIYPGKPAAAAASSDMHEEVVQKMIDLYHMLICHNGFGELSVETRILKRRQKEVIINCGKHYRFVVDKPTPGVGRAEWLLNWKHGEDDASCQSNEHTTPEAGAQNKEKLAQQ